MKCLMPDLERLDIMTMRFKGPIALLLFFKRFSDLYHHCSSSVLCAWGRIRPCKHSSLWKCEGTTAGDTIYVTVKDPCLNDPADYMSKSRKYDAISIAQTLHNNAIVTNNCRRLAITKVVHYVNSAMHLSLNIFTNLQIIWLLHKIGGKQSLRV